ncbi:hypothetical protein R3W88_014492 [Solanum pinnatisectum]|uniref:Uncharacterized protein n=1 Tax=Solanum pinnatisectum TaxID=50273 RepID=A0AAV9KRV8_9SOLN|nr:hypothetical protein R3W88_014492 [Solanum pinnatisectum]
MTRNGENIGLNEIIITNPIITEQNELIAQLAQQIAEMRVEMHKTRELANLAITANAPLPKNEISTLNFPTTNPTPEHFSHNSPTVPVQKPPTIRLNTTNQHHASSSYQIPHPSKTLNSNNSQAFPSMYQTPPQNTSNPTTTQPLPPKATFHIPILTGLQGIGSSCQAEALDGV